MTKKISFFFIVLLSIYASFHLLNIKHASIDRVLLLNLDKRLDRYAYMKNLLSSVELPVPYEKFTAVDGMKLKFIDESNNQSFTGEEAIKEKRVFNGIVTILCSEDDKITFTLRTKASKGLMGSLGNFCSSRNIWQNIKDNNYKNTLILEDDIRLEKNFYNSLVQFTNNAPKDYDILYIHKANIGKAYKSNVKNEYLRLIMNFFDQHIKNPFWKQVRRNFYSLKGYIITPEGASKLLGCTKFKSDHLFVPTDVIISNNCLEKGIVNSYTSKTDLVHPEFENGKDRFYSDIIVKEEIK
jgi:GR25 family glycosyltransferase involved in LPS biosynthesis